MQNVLHSLYTPEDMSNVTSGIRKFIRVLGLELESYQLKRIADEFDLISALDLIPTHMQDSASLLGRETYKGVPYVFTDEVKKDMEEYLLTGKEPKDTAVLRHRNLTMYHLVVEPTIELLGQLDHQQAIDQSRAVVNGIIDMVRNSEDYGDATDALIAKEQITVMIKARTEARKAAKARTTKRKVRASELEYLSDDVIADVISDDSDELIFE
jgi:hypothetical protein